MRTTLLPIPLFRRTTLLLVALIVVSLLASAAASRPASADPMDDIVLEWNLHTMNALNNPPTAPTPGMGYQPQVSILHVAMVQGAIYDAVNMIDGGYQPYLVDAQVDASASKAASISTR